MIKAVSVRPLGLNASDDGSSPLAALPSPLTRPFYAPPSVREASTFSSFGSVVFHNTDAFSPATPPAFAFSKTIKKGEDELEGRWTNGANEV